MFMFPFMTMVPSTADTGVSLAVFAGTSLLSVLILRIRYQHVVEDSTLVNTSGPSKEEVLALRMKHFSKSQSVSYLNSGPLMIVKGEGSRLTDEKGVSYLDTRNNVAHCGHSHPAVIKAVQEQVALLNTNTRYLHPVIAQLAERLTKLLPDPLEVVFFCNSGSEANDMALRLARAYSGGSNNTIVVDGAYHGHTLATLEVSPYKYEHGTEYKASSPGKHIWKVPSPDTYRGKHRDWATAGAEYATYVQDACQHYRDAGEKVRAFIIEGGMSVAGVILPPPGYLSACVQAVHVVGGLYIADEVQTGLGRFGSSCWAFEHCHSPDESKVIPDIVTIGKPFGNGMPLAAVITSKKVAEAFENCGVEYFNTFGGNPVCASAGLAVLNVLQEERLQQKALEVGTYLKSKLRELQERIQLIGDIRGSGLFLGVEFVRSRETLESATAETSFVCSVLKSKYHILTSIDGPYDNVLVIKPPMVFSKSDADYFCQCLDDALSIDLLAAGDMTNISKTPT
jgi:ethanolamine-phosphate phospho-lyase